MNNETASLSCSVLVARLMLPNDERSRPAGNRTALETLDPLAGDPVQHMPDLADVAVDAWQTLTGLLLAAPPVDLARRLLADLPAPAPDPVLNWWLIGVRRNVEALVIPTPPTAADAAIRAGFEPPPALRRHVASSGWLLVSEVTAIPLACADHLAGIVRNDHVRRAAHRAVLAMGHCVWRGDLQQIAETFQREGGGVLALCAAEATR